MTAPGRLSLLAVALLVAGGCSGRVAPSAESGAGPPSGPSSVIPRSPGSTSTGGPAASSPPQPEVTVGNEDFYQPPDPLPRGSPGQLIRLAPLTAPAGTRAWLVLYHSTSLAGKDIAVSGLVVVPDGTPPPQGWPVVAYAHGTTGVARSCAPSKTRGILALYAPLAQRGYVVAATDYEGLGGPGIHPYLVGESEGRSTLDGARAARALPDAHAGGPVLVWGHSQGGQAALFAGQIASRWAPELHIVGVVAGAPAADLTQLFAGSAPARGSFGFVALLADSWSQVYPEARLDTLLTPEAIDGIGIVERECLAQVLSAYANRSASDLLKGSLAGTAPWSRLLGENSAGGVRTPAPLLVIQGDSDQLVPASLTKAFLVRACGLGDTVALKVYPGEDHVSVVRASNSDVIEWMGERLTAAPAPSTCGP